MTDRRTPRDPEDQEYTGTGSARSADNGLPQPGAASEPDADPDVVSGMTSTSQPAFSDDVVLNRSGSGGSGGPAEGDPSVEGSTGQSLSELLEGEDDSEPASD